MIYYRYFLFCFCRFCFICVFAELINKVRLLETVEGVTGGSVVLPCSSTEHDFELQDTDVHWRDCNDKIMYSIIKGKYSVEGQDPRYKNRAEICPGRGNFPLKLINLTNDDAGKLNCFITNPSYSKQETVQLLIDSTAEKEIKSTKQENQREEVCADSVRTSSNWIYIVSALLLLLFI